MWNIKLLYVFQYILKNVIYNILNNSNVDDSPHVKMLMVQKMWKNSLNYSSIITKY